MGRLTTVRFNSVCCRGGGEVITVCITPTQFGWVMILYCDSWTSVSTLGLLGVNFALLSHSDLLVYTYLDCSMCLNDVLAENLIPRCGGGEVVTLCITPTQLGWVILYDSWTSIGVSGLLGVTRALLSHSFCYWTN